MKNQIKKFERSGSFFPTFVNRYLNDDFFNNFFDGELPATNVSETEKEFKLELSVPGFDKNEIKIEIDKHVLKISGQTETKNEEKGEDERVLRREFRSSSFARSFTIPENIDTENISAAQKDGILQITLPKLKEAPEDKVKKIEIK